MMNRTTSRPVTPSTPRTTARATTPRSTPRASFKENYPSFMKTRVPAPSTLPAETPLNSYLLPEFIYGSSKKGCKGNIVHRNKLGKLIYPAAGCAVVYDEQTHTQQVFYQHTDDVVCLAVHPDGLLVATGETGKDDRILIWDSNTLQVVREIDTRFPGGGVLAVAFSQDGKYLAAVGGGEFDSQMYLYDWQVSNKCLAIAKAHNASIFSLDFSPDGIMVLCTKKGVKFFNYTGTLTAKSGVVTPKGTIQPAYSCAFLGGNACVGVEDGSIYCFSGTGLSSVKKAHEQACYTVANINGGLISGGKDGNIIVWKGNTVAELKKVKTISLGSSVRSVIADANGEYAYAMLENGSFEKVSLGSEIVSKSTLMMGHSGKRTELWGLATVANSDLFVSGGDDGKLMLWNRATKKCAGVARLTQQKIRGVAVSPDGKVVAASTFDKSIFLFNLQDMVAGNAKPVRQIACGAEDIAAIQFSPIGNYLAAGSHDNFIYLYDTTNDYKEYKLKGHTSFISHLDFSADGKYLQSVCGAYELLYWNVDEKVQITSSDSMRDVQWHTQTCKLGWSVRGIWTPDHNDGTDINCTDVNFNLRLIATGDDRGKVNLFNFPTLTVFPEYRSHWGHCEHVTNIKFSDDDQHVISAGGADLTIIQWKIMPTPPKRISQTTPVVEAASVEEEVVANEETSEEQIPEPQSAPQVMQEIEYVPAPLPTTPIQIMQPAMPIIKAVEPELPIPQPIPHISDKLEESLVEEPLKVEDPLKGIEELPNTSRGQYGLNYREIIDFIRELAKLKQEGILSEEEFTLKKQQLLGI